MRPSLAEVFKENPQTLEEVELHLAEVEKLLWKHNYAFRRVTKRVTEMTALWLRLKSSRDDMQDLVQRYQAGDHSVLPDIRLGLDGLIYNAAAKFSTESENKVFVNLAGKISKLIPKPGDDHDDGFEQGMLLNMEPFKFNQGDIMAQGDKTLTEALESYDPGRGTLFTTWFRTCFDLDLHDVYRKYQLTLERGMILETVEEFKEHLSHQDVPMATERSVLQKIPKALVEQFKDPQELDWVCLNLKASPHRLPYHVIAALLNISPNTEIARRESIKRKVLEYVSMEKKEVESVPTFPPVVQVKPRTLQDDRTDKVVLQNYAHVRILFGDGEVLSANEGDGRCYIDGEICTDAEVKDYRNLACMGKWCIDCPKNFFSGGCSAPQVNRNFTYITRSDELLSVSHIDVPESYEEYIEMFYPDPSRPGIFTLAYIKNMTTERKPRVKYKETGELSLMFKNIRRIEYNCAWSKIPPEALHLQRIPKRVFYFSGPSGDIRRDRIEIIDYTIDITRSYWGRRVRLKKKALSRELQKTMREITLEAERERKKILAARHI